RRLSIWNRRLSARGGPVVDAQVQKWLSSLRRGPQEYSKKDKEGFIQETKNNLSRSIATIQGTTLEEQIQLEARLMQEKEDERLAQSLYNSFNAIVDRSSESVDAYSLRSKR
ncbi:RING finger protein 168, partial [Caligus rogercresseyi]